MCPIAIRRGKGCLFCLWLLLILIVAMAVEHRGRLSSDVFSSIVSVAVVSGHIGAKPSTYNRYSLRVVNAGPSLHVGWVAILGWMDLVTFIFRRHFLGLSLHCPSLLVACLSGLNF